MWKTVIVNLLFLCGLNFSKADAVEGEPAGWLIDPMNVHDHLDFELTDIIHLSEAPVGKEIDWYNDDDRRRYVELHNIYRSNQTYPLPKAANMNFIEYNKTLEWGAALWLQKCLWKHGRAENDHLANFSSQNLYNGGSKDPARYLYLWYMEYLDYQFLISRCKEAEPGQRRIMCGHFRLMMWGDLEVFGCARNSYCSPRRENTMVSCHYYPKRNYDEVNLYYMYSYGKSCTRCERNEGNLCSKNLCINKRISRQYNMDYTCELNCQNCAVEDRKNCRCKCEKGWDYADCGMPCKDLYIDDPRNPSGDWACPYYMKEEKGCHRILLTHKCRQTCGYCEKLPDKEEDRKGLCCAGKPCPRYSVLDTKTCECKPHCPTFGCLYTDSTNSAVRPFSSTRPFLLQEIFLFGLFVSVWILYLLDNSYF